jgi:hypothetical protein
VLLFIGFFSFFFAFFFFCTHAAVGSALTTAQDERCKHVRG